MSANVRGRNTKGNGGLGEGGSSGSVGGARGVSGNSIRTESDLCVVELITRDHSLVCMCILNILCTGVAQLGEMHRSYTTVSFSVTESNVELEESLIFYH